MSLVSGRAVARALAERGHDVRAWLIDLDGALVGAAADGAGPTRRMPRSFDAPARLGAAGPLSAAAALEVLARWRPRAGGVPRPPRAVRRGRHGPGAARSRWAWRTAAAGPRRPRWAWTRRSSSGCAARSSCRCCRGLEIDAADWRDRRPETVTAPRGVRGRPRPTRDWSSSPRGSGSSIGITIVRRPDEPPELERAVEEALRHDDLALAEPYLDHPRELEVSVVGNQAAGHRGLRSGRGAARSRVLRLRGQVPLGRVADPRDARRRRRGSRPRSGASRGRRTWPSAPAASRAWTSCSSATARPGSRRSTPSRASRPSACSRCLSRAGGHDFGARVRAHRRAGPRAGRRHAPRRLLTRADLP